MNYVLWTPLMYSGVGAVYSELLLALLCGVCGFMQNHDDKHKHLPDVITQD
jgi:hypothetical protein